MINHVYPQGEESKHKLDGMPCECEPDFEVDAHGDIVVIHNPLPDVEAIEG